jgi:LacI family transcriptional regulator
MMDSYFAIYRPWGISAGSEQVLKEIALGVYDRAVATNCPYFVQHVRDEKGVRLSSGAFGLMYSEREVNLCKSTETPLVNFSNTGGAVTGVANVLSDDVAVGKLAAEHFLERKYRSFLAVTQPGRVWDHERFEGFFNTLSGQGFACQKVELELNNPKPSDRTGQQGYSDIVWEQVEPVLEKMPMDTAVFFTSDWLGWPVLNQLRRTSNDRYHTTALLGVDNLHDSLFDPRRTAGLSSILPGFRAAGSIGLDLLMDAAMNGADITSIHKRVPPAKLYTRASTVGTACDDPLVGKITRELWGCLQRRQPISFHKIAKENQISLRSIELRFEQKLGKTARSVLADMRMDLGKKLLSETYMPVSDISELCGYANTTTFSNTFRKAVGASPRDWRKKFDPPPLTPAELPVFL